MPSKYAGMSGRAILKESAQDIRRLGVEMSLLAEYDHLPVEHRQRVRNERIVQIRAIQRDASAALQDWAENEAADARRTLASRPVGTAAEEARRAADETRISRIVSEARANGNARQVRDELADRANAAYELGSIDEADVLARASVELSGPKLARDVTLLVKYDRDAADPAKSRAQSALGDVAVVTAAFHRDVNAAVSMAYQDASKLSAALGDHVAAQASLSAASEHGRTAKIAAALESKPFGGQADYAEPAGVVPGIPTNVGRVPDGARLPEPRP